MDDFFSENTVTGKPLEILVVEDAAAHAKVTLAALDQLPFRHRVSLVRDGAAAVQFLRQEGIYRRAPRPELLMLDSSVLATTGSVALDVLRTTPDLADVPVIVVADAEVDEIVELPACVRHLLKKPVQLDSFLQVMRAIREEVQHQGRFGSLDLVG
jgi:CheY-like chemotaxis protein